MAKAYTIDIWSQIHARPHLSGSELAAGANQQAEMLTLGHSHRDDVLKFCGLRASKIRWHQRQASDFAGAEQWPYAQSGNLYLFFDPHMRWQGLNWEPEPDGHSIVTWTALKEGAPADDEGVLEGRLQLLLNGKGLRHYAVLPDFIGSLASFDADFKLRSATHDKWLKLTTRGNSGTLVAEFMLRALKARFESRFEIDYCLSSLTLLAPELAEWSV